MGGWGVSHVRSRRPCVRRLCWCVRGLAHHLCFARQARGFYSPPEKGDAGPDSGKGGSPGRAVGTLAVWATGGGVP